MNQRVERPFDPRCPKCGKPMTEEPHIPGYWTCVDNKTPMNDRAPFIYKCDGAQITQEGHDAFRDKIQRQISGIKL